MPRAARIILDKKEENAAGLLSELCRGKRQFRQRKSMPVKDGKHSFVFFKERSAFRKKNYYEYRPKCLFSFDGYSGSFEKRGRG